ncbi:MAG: hypothetical protein AAF919_07690 [Pseudomonadota bacterium]
MSVCINGFNGGSYCLGSRFSELGDPVLGLTLAEFGILFLVLAAIVVFFLRDPA